METIHILGLGPTLKNYTPDRNISIGVNDIWKHHPADYVVCVDSIRRFTPERQASIISGKQKKFFSIVKHWNFIVQNYEFVDPRNTMHVGECKENIPELDSGKIIFSSNSAFFAACIAFHMKPKQIIMHGVDFTDHHKLGKPSILERSVNDFKKLFFAFDNRGVKLCVSSEQSALAGHIAVLGK